METHFSIISVAILLMFVLDPFGNIPLLISLIRHYDRKRQLRIIAREMSIGLAILLFFLFFGNSFLSIFHLETSSVTIAGGVIFFIIGLRLSFPGEKGAVPVNTDEEPFVVPIAMPMIAGPSALASLLVLSKQHPTEHFGLFVALLLAWILSAIVMLMSPLLLRVLKNKGLIALERLMGMLLLIMSVQMFVNGIRGVISTIQ